MIRYKKKESILLESTIQKLHLEELHELNQRFLYGQSGLEELHQLNLRFLYGQSGQEYSLYS